MNSNHWEENFHTTKQVLIITGIKYDKDPSGSDSSSTLDKKVLIAIWLLQIISSR